MQNKNPQIIKTKIQNKKVNLLEGKTDLSEENIFEALRIIKDPEHPYTLEELQVISLASINITHLESNENVLPYLGLNLRMATITFSPTIPHCSMAGIIGLSIHYQIRRYFDDDVWFRILIEEGKHVNWEALNKQLNDKERVNAALENEDMINLIKELTK